MFSTEAIKIRNEFEKVLKDSKGEGLFSSIETILRKFDIAVCKVHLSEMRKQDRKGA